MSFQGRRFAAQEFPSPAYRLPCFSSCSRCLIDLGKTFVVLTEGSGLFRLETVDRSNIRFEDDTQLSTDECAALLEAQLEALTECDTVKAGFPFFDQTQLETYMFRPCVSLYGTAGLPLYLPIYSHNGKRELCDWELVLENLSPAPCVSVVIDVSKMCGLPETYDDPMQKCHGMTTYGPWYLSAGKKHRPVAARKPNALRGKIVALLLQLLRNTPTWYFDSTIQGDIGALVTRKVLMDGYSQEMYAGPPA